MRESRLLKDVLKELNLDGRVRLRRNSVGFDLERKIRYGLGNGSPDAVGTLRGGVCFCLETKSTKGRASKEQLAWWRSAGLWGIEGGFCWSVEEAFALLEDACLRRSVTSP